MTDTTVSSRREVRRAEDRGATELGWLHSRHSFSFGRYHDPQRMGYRSLRVLNDDVVEPGAGFGEHGHDHMEIISWVLDGALRHRDSTGGGGVIRPGTLQVMSAGTGIRHSEMNASDAERVHFLQVWIEPAERDLEPRYAERAFPAEGRRDRWQLVASGDGRDGSLLIHRDAALSIATLGAGARLTASIGEGRHGYLHVARGSVTADGAALNAGDALAFAGPDRFELVGGEPSELLLFDLA